ncbi:MAG: BamA/TamA family outer membrane protein [Cyclobacteriaceae bacterium]
MIPKIRYFLLILIPILLSGCLGTKHLKENQKHLYKQSIKAPQNINEEELRALYAQNPNRTFLSIPGMYYLVAIYYAGEKRYAQEKFIRKKAEAEKRLDAKIAKTRSLRKINNLQFRKQKKIDKYNSRIENGNLLMQWGESIAVYDSALVNITVNRLKNYLFSEGYFQNDVRANISSLRKFVRVNYEVQVGQPYLIDSIFYRISDSTVFDLIRQTEKSSLIKKGERYREDNFTNERERIDLYLKDNGFYDFSRQYVDFDIDTSLLENKKVAVMITIRDPAKRGFHKQFSVDSVRFTTDATVIIPGVERTQHTYRDVRYRYYHDNYNLKILSQRVFLAPGNLYSRTSTFDTQRQLANLDAFKFVNVNYDSTGGTFIANIFTSALDRYEWSNEIGVNVTEGYPGPFYNLNFKKRNLFGGLENFELNGRIGIEGVAAATQELDVYKSTEAGINASVTFPQFLWPFRNATQIRLGKYNPKTRLSVGYNYTDRPEYKRTSTTFSNTYTWQNQRTTQFSLALTNISLINSEIKSEAFRQQLDSLDIEGNYNLARSFEPSFVSSMIFSITWNKNYGTFDRNAVFIRAQFEPGGTTLNFIDPKIISRQGLQYFKYWRLNFDFRQIRILSSWATFAYRINTGVAYSYGSDRSLPYEKYYFAGGSNSIRAWRPRRLGLGSVPPKLSTDPSADADPVADGLFNYQLEKPGEILFEGSMELRSKLFGFVGGAIFIDAGNVWLFSQQTSLDPDTGELEPVPGNSKFRLDSFYKELGIGTGFGLRFDFTFLVLRFDVGIKVYDPGRQPGDRFVLDEARLFKPFATQTGENTYTNFKEPVIYNIGIGYPF